ncbi:MAG: DUF1850 domain-containing protein [Clostridia bacterium]|jgi:hypothetical protein|nr:DUF1850 domain-containing protein [Clostridia bacterium]MCI1999688.1 DUF1850 domain-containing protein [Clostridia bacterium]MCI2013933.1 DUF1850 domain-containing protein [Clostridia bacterium]
MSKKLLLKMAAAAILLVLIAVAILFVEGGGWCLTLSNRDTGKIYACYRMSEGDVFSIGFVHSVNKSPVIDYYKIHDKKIYVIQTKYYDFGAGVQTEVEKGQTLSYGDDGSMIVSGFNKEMDNLVYCIGMVSDHTLQIGDKKIGLRALCGRGTLVRFSYGFHPIKLLLTGGI